MTEEKSQEKEDLKDEFKEKIQIRDKNNNRAYFSIVPNIIYELGLSPQEIGLYCFLKNIENKDNICWWASSTICKKLNISKNTYLKLRETLAGHFDLINGPLIRIEKRINEKGSFTSTLITIENITDQNNYYYSKERLRCSKSEQGVVQNMNKGCSKSEHKQYQCNKNQCEEVNDINDIQTSRVSKSKSDIDVIDDIDPFSKGGSLNGPKKYLNDKAQINFFDELKKKNIDTDDETLCYWIKTYTKEKIVGAYKSAIKHKANSIGAYMGGLLKKEFKHESKNVLTCIEIARKFVSAKPESFHFGFDDETYEYWYDVGSGEVCDTFESMHPQTFAKLLSDKLRVWEGR